MDLKLLNLMMPSRVFHVTMFWALKFIVSITFQLGRKLIFVKIGLLPNNHTGSLSKLSLCDSVTSKYLVTLISIYFSDFQNHWFNKPYRIISFEVF